MQQALLSPRDNTVELRQAEAHTKETRAPKAEERRNLTDGANMRRVASVLRKAYASDGKIGAVTIKTPHPKENCRDAKSERRVKQGKRRKSTRAPKASPRHNAQEIKNMQEHGEKKQNQGSMPQEKKRNVSAN